VSQPSSRSAVIAAPGQVDPALGEFWVENPWDIVKSGHNLSAYERNRTWMNLRGGNFIDLSYLTGMDSEGDGRCVVAGDFHNNGRLDVVVRQIGGGSLLFFENRFPQRHYLKVTLRGRPLTLPSPPSEGGEGRVRGSNRQGVGARLSVLVNGQQLVREMYPLNSFRSQMPNIVHFGLGDATKVDRLTIRWPSGKIQELTALPADRHVVIDEGKQGVAAIKTVVPGETIEP
jgi:hypothetical protein